MRILHGDGSSFAYNELDKSANYARSVYVTDVDGDEIPDVVSARTDAGNEELAWYKTARGTATEDDSGVSFAWTAIATEVLVSSVTRDCDDDEAVLNDGCTVVENTVDELTAAKVYVADFDDDDKLDVLYADETHGILAWHAQPASGTDWGSSLIIDYDPTNKAKWVVAADFE